MQYVFYTYVSSFSFATKNPVTVIFEERKYTKLSHFMYEQYISCSKLSTSFNLAINDYEANCDG